MCIRDRFLNDALLIQEGVTVLSGSVVDNLRGIQDGYALSENGRYVIFEAELAGSVEGAFLLDRGVGITALASCVPDANPADLDYAGGSASVGGTLSLGLDQAPTLGETGVLGISATPIPSFPPCGIFLAGIGEVFVDVFTPGLLQIPLGAWTGGPLVTTFGVPANPSLVGVSVYAQGVFINALAMDPLTLSNGLEITLQP